MLLTTINEESKLFYWLIIKTWSYFGHWLIGLIQRPKSILLLFPYSLLIGWSGTRRIITSDHWFLIQWLKNIHLWFLSLFSLANSYLLLSFPSRIHHHKVFLLHFNLQIHMRSKYTSLLYAPPLLLSGWSFSSLMPTPWSFLCATPPVAFSVKPLPLVRWRRWRRERRRRHEEGRRRCSGDDRGRRRCGGDGGSDEPDTEAEVDVVQRKVFWAWGMKHEGRSTRTRKQDVAYAVVLVEGGGLGLGLVN